MAAVAVLITMTVGYRYEGMLPNESVRRLKNGRTMQQKGNLPNHPMLMGKCILAIR